MKSQVTLHDSAWFKVNADGTEIPIEEKDWEKVVALVELHYGRGKAPFIAPTPLKLYELDVEFQKQFNILRFGHESPIKGISV